MGEIGHFGKKVLKCMKFHTEQAGLWLKPNTASQLKPDMPQADISSIYDNPLSLIQPQSQTPSVKEHLHMVGDVTEFHAGGQCRKPIHSHLDTDG